MDTSIELRTPARPQLVLDLVARVEQWPRWLPHYRLVRVLADHGQGQRTIEMAAVREVVPRLGVPLHWVARQTVRPDRVEFVHVGGVTRGMEVAWTYEPLADGQTVVRIRHVFRPRWPAPDAVVRAILGEYFVNGVARKTLRRLCELAAVRTRHEGVNLLTAEPPLRN